MEAPGRDFIKGRSYDTTGNDRRVMAVGAELVNKAPPIATRPGETPFGDTSRPSASIIYN